MSLLQSKRAATLPLLAASIIPLIGIIGGSVDMTRAYLVKTKLQQACDGAALAARRSMTTQTLQTADRTRGQNFFDSNLKQGVTGSFGAQNIVLTLTDVTNAQGVSNGAVHGHATADVPLTLMRVFRPNGTLTMEVDCEAQLNISNNDVLFVLDVTGSMSCLTSDSTSTCGSYASSNAALFNGRWGTTEKANSRIDGLRVAVENFAATLSSATPTSARLRIGFVPYSENASVGGLLYAVNPAWLNTSVTVNTKKFNYNNAVYIPSTPTPDAPFYQDGGNKTPSQCRTYGDAANSGVMGGPAPADTWIEQYDRGTWNGSSDQSTWTGSTSRNCKRLVTRLRTTYTTKYRYSNVTYGSSTFDASDFVAGTGVMLATAVKTSGTQPDYSDYSLSDTNRSYNMQELYEAYAAGTVTNVTATKNSVWDGCILERSSPADDITTAPTSSSASKWSPAWADVIFNGSGTQPTGNNYSYHYACSKRVNNWGSLTTAGATHFLNPITSSNLPEVGQYVNVANGAQITSPSPYPDFLALGYTYHDIGMMWAARLMAPSGLFSYEHTAAPNGKPVNRHIIFMTDGDMQTTSSAYSAYGFDGSGDTAHNTRFLAACQAAKDQGVSIWVVSFANGTLTASDPLTQCANANQAFSASNASELNQMFQIIAQRIGDLRLTQ